MTPHQLEDRLRAFLVNEAKDAMALTDTDAELRRFQQSISHSHGPSRRTWIAAAAAAAVVATAGGATVLLGDGETPPVTQVAAAGSFDESAALPSGLALTDVGLRPSLSDGAFPAGDALWHVSRDGTLERIDPDSGEVTLVDPGVPAHAPVVEADGLVWFAGGAGNRQRFYALDPATNEVVRQTPVVPSARWIGSGPAGLWAVTGPRELTEIDASTGRLLRTLATENGLYDVVVGHTTLYSGPQINSKGLTVVDVSSGQSRVVLPEAALGGMVLTADGDLWLHDLTRPALVRVNGTTFAEEASVSLPLSTSRGSARNTYWTNEGERVDTRDGWGEEGQTFIAATDDALYASMNPGSTPVLMRADVDTGDVTHVFQIGEGGSRGPVTVAGGSLWLDWKPGDDLLRRVVEFD